MIRLFVDMDGTLAVFSYEKTIEDLYKKGYFENLKPIYEVVDAIKHIITDTPIEVYILSAYLSKSNFALAEKQKWLDKYLPEIKISNRIFLPYPENKAEAFRSLSKDDYLLDDYTPNLISWNKKGGIGIKLLNGINNKTGLWKGLKIGYDDIYLVNNLIHLFLDKNIDTTDEEIPGQLKLDKSIFKID